MNRCFTIVVIIVLCFGHAARADITTGLVTYYPFDDGAGTTAVDATGNGHDATLYGPAWGSGVISGGLSFDGTDDTVEDLAAGAYLNGMNRITVAVWVRSTVVGEDRGIFFTRDPTGADEELGLRYDAAGSGGGAVSNIKASIRTTPGSTQSETGSNQQTTNWQHLVIVWRPGRILRIFVNGLPAVLSYDEGSLGGNIAGVTKLMIGRCTEGRYWSGLMDEFRIYGRELSDADVWELYNWRSGPIAYYAFESGSGQAAIDSTTFAQHGTLGSTPGADGNDPAWGAGYCGSGLLFDGVGTYVEVAHAPQFLMDNGTIAFWFNAVGTGFQGLISKDSAGRDTGGQFSIYLDGADLYASLERRNYTRTLGPVTVATGTWVHAAFTFGGNGMRLYVDGAQRDSHPYTGGLGSTSGGSGNYEPMAFGVSTASSGNGTMSPWFFPLLGAMDEVRIYSYALSASDIALLLVCPSPPQYQVYRWREVIR